MCIINLQKLLLQETRGLCDRMTITRRRQVIAKVMVKWKHQILENATWKFSHDFCTKFSSFHF